MTLSDEECIALRWATGVARSFATTNDAPITKAAYLRNAEALDLMLRRDEVVTRDTPDSQRTHGGGMAGHDRDNEDPATPSWLLHAVRVFVITCPTPGFFTDVARKWLRDEGQPDPYVAGPHTEADAKLLRSVPRDVPEAQVTRFVDLILRRYYYLVQSGHEKNADATVREIVRELGFTIVP